VFSKSGMDDVKLLLNGTIPRSASGVGELDIRRYRE